ncbi:serine hydrolase domain-containing protein [Embleya hyalina]|uniref:Serine hydrolase n=1 Tax=Embleya hyalina TaxID=516124 RepID=A0A401Z0B7_9ACTN|nr:serine hydrolase domain-containing protein [Embleya hyalina]GCE00268.1 serine hydrolase [Embleya hyalina]
MGRSDVSGAAARTLPTPEYLATRLGELAKRGNIPGASVAVRMGDETVAAATGVLDAETGYPATTGSIFQIGSITKVWTATLIMQLVDEGVLDLDAPVRTFLPDFKLPDEAAAASVTVRQLLCHTAGFEGDLFEDFGPGDDAVAGLVGHLADHGGRLFAPGEMFSYCNSGYVALGRIVEVLTGQTWEATLRERITVPLGLTRVASGAAEAILHRVAIGHVAGPDGTTVKAPVWQLPRSNAPAGSTLATTATDLVAFAAAHVARGLLPDGTRLLSEASALAMRESQVDVPDIGAVGTAWGLGWNLFDWAGGPVIGHDGGTLGQAAILRVAPESGVSIAILTNGGELGVMYELVREVLASTAGVGMPEPVVPPVDPPLVDARFFVGRYASQVLAMDVVESERGFELTTRTLGAAADVMGETVHTTALVARDARTLIAVEAKGGQHEQYAFVGDGDRARFLHMTRALPRVVAGEPVATTGAERADADSGSGGAR